MPKVRILSDAIEVPMVCPVCLGEGKRGRRICKFQSHMVPSENLEITIYYCPYHYQKVVQISASEEKWLHLARLLFPFPILLGGGLAAIVKLLEYHHSIRIWQWTSNSGWFTVIGVGIFLGLLSALFLTWLLEEIAKREADPDSKTAREAVSILGFDAYRHQDDIVLLEILNPHYAEILLELNVGKVVD